MQCRGEESRRRIVNKYNLKAVAHVQLLAGQKKLSCTNIILTDSYYCFSYGSKDGKHSGAFLCGSHAANHFLELTGLAPLPLFNPLTAEKPRGGGNGGKGNPTRRPWNQTAKQLNNAINLLIVCWDIAPGGVLSKIKGTISKYYYNVPYPKEIKAINTIISKDPHGRTLQEMIDELTIHNNVRNFDFGLLNAVLKESGIESNYG